MRLLLATVLGAIVLFFWGAISWTLLPLHNMTVSHLPDEAAVVDQLQGSIDETGVYIFPWHDETTITEKNREEMMANLTERHERGPIGMIIYNNYGTAPMTPSVFIKGIVLNLASALLASLLLLAAAGSLGGYLGRVVFVTGLGVFAALMSDLMMWTYMYIPTDYTLVNAADHIVGSLLLGLVIAALIRPKQAAAQQSAV